MEMARQPAPVTNPAKPAVSGKYEPPVPSPAAPVAPLSDLDKLQAHAQKTLDAATARPAALQEASFGLSITSGYFSSIGAGETLRDDIREYYFEMLRRINEKWWLNRESHQAGRKGAVFYLVIARNGAIVDRMLMESSGNPVCDRAMLHTLEAAGPLPPLPNTYRGDFFQAPLRFNMPLNLLESLKMG
jgi:protein TonB